MRLSRKEKKKHRSLFVKINWHNLLEVNMVISLSNSTSKNLFHRNLHTNKQRYMYTAFSAAVSNAEKKKHLKRVQSGFK